MNCYLAKFLSALKSSLFIFETSIQCGLRQRTAMYALGLGTRGLSNRDQSQK
uniref:Uncharacterized protein n=1 Tax=Rhizophora mucronata TaxID=61149 RepID=A0A2P2N8X2_RHIMU